MRFTAASRQSLEGDYFSTGDATIFTVIGSTHPTDAFIAIPKHRPSKHTYRRGGKSYTKVGSLSEAYEYLQRTHPNFLVFDHVFDCELCKVPRSEVNQYWRPENMRKKLLETVNPDPVQKDAIELLALLRKSCGIPPQSMGITGSLLASVHSVNSDLDVIFYGTSVCRRTYLRIGQLLDSKKSPLRRYHDSDLRRLYEIQKKDTGWSYADFARCQVNRNLQGKFKERDFFLRMLRPPEIVEEVYGEKQYTNLGRATLRGVVASDDDSIFTPCIYPLTEVESPEGSPGDEICEVVSYRGRFCEAVRKGESLMASGKVEKVQGSGEAHLRLLVGSDPRDILVAVN